MLRTVPTFSAIKPRKMGHPARWAIKVFDWMAEKAEPHRRGENASERIMGIVRSVLAALVVIVSVGCARVYAQDAKQIVQKAVDEELAAARSDHSHWRYLDKRKESDDSVYSVVETSEGSVKRLIERGGQPLSQADAQAEAQRVESFIHSPSQLRKQQRDSVQDDKNAEDLLKLLPVAFLWTVGNDTGDLVTLNFTPDPKFDPPDMKAKVLGAMTGELVIDKKGHRIRTIKGRLTDDVNIGWGLLGKLHKGGTFEVERRQVGPGLWQIVETHVHIHGRVLFFKNIGEEQDEIQTGFTRVPDSTTLEDAVKMLEAPPPDSEKKFGQDSGK